MFFNDNLKLSMDILRSRVDDLKNSMQNWWSDLDSLRKKVNGLYKFDYHNTERPKVDILSDRLTEEEGNLWNAIGELQKRANILEEKK